MRSGLFIVVAVAGCMADTAPGGGQGGAAGRGLHGTGGAGGRGVAGTGGESVSPSGTGGARDVPNGADACQELAEALCAKLDVCTPFATAVI